MSHQPSEQEQTLLRNLELKRDELKELLASMNEEGTHEDGFYRFYHQSFKVYDRYQPAIRQGSQMLAKLVPGASMHPHYKEIVKQALSARFSMAVNQTWVASTGPIVAAFFHVRTFVEFAVKASDHLDQVRGASMLDSYWAALLSLYGLR